MNGLTARERRLVALAILLAIVAAAWTLGVAPIVAGFARRGEQRARDVAEIVRNDRLIAAFPVVRAQAARLRRSSEAYALSAATPAIAAARARDRLARLVTAAGGAIRAIRSQPGAAGAPGLVRLQVEMRLTEVGLKTLLRRLENDRPFAVVEALSVVAADPARGDAAASDSAQPLEIRLDLSYSYAS